MFCFIGMFRMMSILPLWVFTFHEYLRLRKEEEGLSSASLLSNSSDKNGNANSTSAAAAWWANLGILWIAVSGGVTLLFRCITGACLADMPLSVCNPQFEEGGLPTESVLGFVLCVLAFPVIIKCHDAVYSFAAFFVTFASCIAALIITSANETTSTVILVSLIGVGFTLLDYEKCSFNLFLSHKNAEESHAQALRTSKAHKTIQEENEQLSIMMGNVAHDLKTPLQSLIADIDALESVLEALSRGARDKSLATADEYQQSELKGIITSLKQTYSFSIIAINRGEDFRMAVAGIPLQPREDVVHVADSMKWAVSCMDGTTTSVALRIMPSSNTTSTSTTTTTSHMCPLIITDKHWFIENIFSLVSNGLKFTGSGSVEVEHRLVVRLTNTSTSERASLPVVVEGLVLRDLFSTVQEETTRPPRARSVHGAVTLPHISISDNHHTSASVSSTTTSLSPPLYLLVLVHDTGTGIPPEKRGSVFQCSHTQAQRGTGGTGLGLFTVAKRMEALGGHCGVQDREDGRAGVIVWLAYPYKPDWSAVDTIVDCS